MLEEETLVMEERNIYCGDGGRIIYHVSSPRDKGYFTSKIPHLGQRLMGVLSHCIIERCGEPACALLFFLKLCALQLKVMRQVSN